MKVAKAMMRHFYENHLLLSDLIFLSFDRMTHILTTVHNQIKTKGPRVLMITLA